MKFLITILTVATAGFNLCAQDESKWAVGIKATPQVYLDSTDFKSGDYTGYELSSRVLNLNVGLRAQYTLSNRWSIISGIDYSTKDFEGLYYCHVCDLAVQGPERIKIRFLEVPFVGRFQLASGKWGVHADLGLTPGMLIQEIESKYDDPLSSIYGKQNTFGRFNISGNAGLGVNYHILPGVSVELTGFYSHSFLTGDYHNFKSIGLGMGVMYKI